MTVTASTIAPTAVDDSATVTEDAAATAVDVLANDTDPDGGPSRIASVTQPANGTVAITGGGTGLTYAPNANYCNSPPGTTLDTFTYTLAPGGSTRHRLDDRHLRQRRAGRRQRQPRRWPRTPARTPVDVLANDTDVDGGPMSIQSVTQPANGTVVITGGGTGLTYTPDPNYCGRSRTRSPTR